MRGVGDVRAVARFTGLRIFDQPEPGADAPGFMLPPAPQAEESE
jgi:hypothetical protein